MASILFFLALRFKFISGKCATFEWQQTKPFFFIGFTLISKFFISYHDKKIDKKNQTRKHEIVPI